MKIFLPLFMDLFACAVIAGCTHVDGNFPDLDPDDYHLAEADWCVHSTPRRLVAIEPTSDYFGRIANRHHARRRRLVEMAGERVAAGRDAWNSKPHPLLYRLTDEAEDFAFYRGETLPVALAKQHEAAVLGLPHSPSPQQLSDAPAGPGAGLSQAGSHRLLP